MYNYNSLADVIDEKCLEFGNRESLVFPSYQQTYTYREFQALTMEIAKGLLAIGIKKGDHLAIFSLNSPKYIALEIAAARIGAVLVCINTSSTKSELLYVLNQSESSLLFISSGVKGNSYIELINSICPELAGNSVQLDSKELPHLKTVVMLDNMELPGILPLHTLLKRGDKITTEEIYMVQKTVSSKDPLNIFYTSGTTGNAKGVVLNHFVTVNNAISSGERMQYEPEDRVLLCLPLFHVIGCVLSTVAGLFYGSAIVIAERFETSKIPGYIMNEGCTVLNAVPTMFNFLLNNDLSAYDLTTMSKGFIAGSCCSEELLLRIRDELGIETIANLYGQTEAIGITQMAAEDSLHHRITTIGRPLPGVDVKVIDIATGNKLPVGEKGELCVKTIYLMQGYYNNQEATNKAIDIDGWLHTGDLVSIDNEGFITIEGRIKDIIIRGGENISAVEIENALKRHPGILEAAIIGVPDKLLGEEICAVLIKNTTYTAPLNKETILTYASGELAKFKLPKYIFFTDSLPITSSGKIRKNILREQFKMEFEKLITMKQ